MINISIICEMELVLIVSLVVLKFDFVLKQERLLKCMRDF